MYKVTPEEIANIYHRETIFVSKGFYPRKIVNFASQKSSDNWVYFERFAVLCCQNGGQLDPDLYITALAQFYKGWFEAKLLCQRSSIKIYNNYIEKMKCVSSVSDITNQIKNSLSFIIKHMFINKLENFNSYMSNNINLVPDIAKHYYSGNVSIYFLAMIPDIEIFLKNILDSGIAQTYFCDILDCRYSLRDIRRKVLRYPEMIKIFDNLDKIIENGLTQIKVKHESERIDVTSEQTSS